jgi:hypothetical protein
MAGQTNYNPGTIDAGSPIGSVVPTLKPGSNLNAQPKPMPIANGQIPSLQQDAQARLPYAPNNGNPNGAHNNSRAAPRLRNTRFGGGHIGASAPEGSVRGVNGISFGRGALTANQVAGNERRTQQFNQQQQTAQQMMAPQGVPQFSPEIQARFQQLMQDRMNRGNGGLPPSPMNGQQQPISASPLPGAMAPPPGGYAPPPYQGQQQQPYPQQTTPIDYGYMGGQNPDLSRYRPPQMVNGTWTNQDQGGYRYNLPNAYGPYPNYQQGPYGYGSNYG